MKKKQKIKKNIEMQIQKLRVGVLMGGKSLEKEVSFLSGRTICDHLDIMRYDIIPLFQMHNELYILPWHFLHRGKTSDFEHRLADEAEKIMWDDLKQRIDFVYIAQHGSYAEDGILQGLLEVLGIPYLGSGIFASATRVNKIIQKTFLIHAGIKVPQHVVVYPAEIEQFTEHKKDILQKIVDTNLGDQLVIKPYNEGSSFGVSIISHYDQLEQALRHACFIELSNPVIKSKRIEKKKVLIEEKISGMEFTCIVIMNNVTDVFCPLPPTEIMYQADSLFFDYEQKYMPGRGTKITPARCSDEVTRKIQDTSVAVMKALGLTTIGRIDGFVTKENEIVIIDANTLSGMAPSSFIFNQAAQIGMSQTDLINHLIATEIASYGIVVEHEQNSMKSNAMDNKKMRIAVLFGGASHEKETSLDSGRNVFYKLSPHIYQPIPLFVSSTMELYHITHKQIVHNSTREIELELSDSQKIMWGDLPTIADFVFIALHGGEGENGAVQGMLEMLDMPYNGSSVFTSSLCMNKFKTTEFLSSHGFEVPRNLFVSADEWSKNYERICNEIVSYIALPCIIKPHDDGCSMMVQKVQRGDQLRDAIDRIFSSGKDAVLVEEYVVGMELTVGVIGNDTVRALPPSQTISVGDILTIEEKFLPGAGENQTPAPLPQSALRFVMSIVENVYKIVQCKGYARIDCFYQSADANPTGVERVVILEINTLPALTPATCLFHQAAEVGFKPMEFIDEIIRLGCQEHDSQFLSYLPTIKQIAPLIRAAKKHHTDAKAQ